MGLNMTERVDPTLEKLQILERNKTQWSKRLFRVEAMSSRVARPEKPQSEWSIEDHILAAKHKQLGAVYEKVGVKLFQASTNLDQAVLEYHQQNQAVLPEQQQERRRLLVLRNMARRGFADISVEEVDQQIQDFEQSLRPLSESLQERLNKLLQKQPAETPQKLSEEETLPDFDLDEENMTLSVDSTVISLGKSQLIFIKSLFAAEGKPVSINYLGEILNKAGFNSKPPMIKFAINEKAGREIVQQTGSRKEGFQYVLSRVIPEAPLQPNAEEITQLEASIASLTASRVNIAEGAELNLPGSKEQLQQLDDLLKEKTAQMEQLRN